MQYQIRTNSLTRNISEYIETHPGCTRKEIVSAIAPDTNPQVVSNLMGRLQRQGVIENRGGFAKYACWYLVELKPKSEYLKLAENILEQLSTIHHSRRAEYLAEQLEARKCRLY